MLAINVIDVEFLKDEFSDFLPNFLLRKMMVTPLSLSMVHSL